MFKSKLHYVIAAENFKFFRVQIIPLSFNCCENNLISFLLENMTFVLNSNENNMDCLSNRGDSNRIHVSMFHIPTMRI